MCCRDFSRLNIYFLVFSQCLKVNQTVLPDSLFPSAAFYFVMTLSLLQALPLQGFFNDHNIPNPSLLKFFPYMELCIQNHAQPLTNSKDIVTKISSARLYLVFHTLYRNEKFKLLNYTSLH